VAKKKEREGLAGLLVFYFGEIVGGRREYFTLDATLSASAVRCRQFCRQKKERKGPAFVHLLTTSSGMRLSVPPYLNDGRPAQRSCLSSPGSIILPIQSCISTILLLYAYRYIHISVCLVHHHTVLINKSRRKMIPLVSMGRPTWNATWAAAVLCCAGSSSPHTSEDFTSY
jgi:hypothetical protein